MTRKRCSKNYDFKGGIKLQGDGSLRNKRSHFHTNICQSFKKKKRKKLHRGCSLWIRDVFQSFPGRLEALQLERRLTSSFVELHFHALRKCFWREGSCSFRSQGFHSHSLLLRRWSVHNSPELREDPHGAQSTTAHFHRICFRPSAQCWQRLPRHV